MSLDGWAFHEVCYTDSASAGAAVASWASTLGATGGVHYLRLSSVPTVTVAGSGQLSVSFSVAAETGASSTIVNMLPLCDSSIMVNQKLMHQIFDVPSPDDYTVAFASGFMPIMLIFLGSLGIKYILQMIGWIGDQH